jgi:VanZ family protein
MEMMNPELRYRKLWLSIGYLLIVVVVFLSLTSNPVQFDTSLPYQDKLLHALAYFSLTFWFMQIYHIRHHVFKWVTFFFCLGMLLEFLQGFDSNRFGEVGDMVANTLGVFVAVALARTPLRYILVRLERHIS